jgi:hypothetical protein
MRRLNYKLINWLLALAMVFSPLSGMASVNFLVNEHGAPCAMSSSSHADMMMQVAGDELDQGFLIKCKMNHGERCQAHPGCSAHVSLSTIIADPVQTIPLSISQKMTVTDDDVVAVYLALLERPPRA